MCIGDFNYDPILRNIRYDPVKRPKKKKGLTKRESENNNSKSTALN